MIAININYHSHHIYSICLHFRAWWFVCANSEIFPLGQNPNFTAGWNIEYFKFFGMKILSSLQKYQYLTAHSHTGQSLGFNQQNHVWWFQFPLLCRKNGTQRLLSCFYSIESNEQKTFFPNAKAQTRQVPLLCVSGTSTRLLKVTSPDINLLSLSNKWASKGKQHKHKHQCMNHPLLHMIGNQPCYKFILDITILEIKFIRNNI